MKPRLDILWAQDFSPEDWYRFWSRVEKTNSCWIWKGECKSDGYGIFSTHSMPRIAVHRISFTLIRGSIPSGLTLDHLCRVRSCVNPSHLEPVTDKENVLRGAGPTAINYRKTSCPYGHLLDVINARGDRRCSTCTRLSRRRYVERKHRAIGGTDAKP